MAAPKTLIFLFLSYLDSLALAQTQFIYYNGTITGSLHPGPSSPSSCVSYNLTDYPIANASIQVGINPPWDTNPFYISFSHSGNTAVATINECLVQPCTFDAIWDLSFVSADYVCIDSTTGTQCQGFLNAGDNYEALELLDLNKATVTPIQLAGESGYSVVGDQSTFVSNGTVVNGFDFQEPYNYQPELTTCFDAPLVFSWNASTPFTYAVNFTNTTATALFTINAPYGNVTMSFSGVRLDDLSYKYDAHNPFDNGNFTAIALNTSNPKVPTFTFVNGSKIEFKNNSGSWDVTSSNLKSGGVEVVRVRWLLLLFMGGIGGFVLLS